VKQLFDFVLYTLTNSVRDG